MPTGTRIYEIFLGTPVEAPSSVVILGSGTAGTLGAIRRLVHTDSVNFPPLVYARNPDRTINLDNAVLPAPLSVAQLTLDSTRVTRFERRVEDVICTEIWEASPARAAMIAQQARLLYEYMANPPAFNPVTPVYIQWEPRDRTDRVYQVEILDLTIGGRDAVDVFDFEPRRAGGGLFQGGSVANPLDDLDTVETTLVDREVRLRLRIVAEV